MKAAILLTLLFSANSFAFVHSFSASHCEKTVESKNTHEVSPRSRVLVNHPDAPVRGRIVVNENNEILEVKFVGAEGQFMNTQWQSTSRPMISQEEPLHHIPYFDDETTNYDVRDFASITKNSVTTLRVMQDASTLELRKIYFSQFTEISVAKWEKTTYYCEI